MMNETRISKSAMPEEDPPLAENSKQKTMTKIQNEK